MTDPKTRGQMQRREERPLIRIGDFLNDISSEIIQPILPLFIAQLGEAAWQWASSEGVSDGLPSILKSSGCWSDRLGKESH